MTPTAPAQPPGARCPQCGAPLAGGETCHDRHTAGQLKELANPAYWAVHHLSVPCWHLQHDGYSREGWLAAYRLLIRFLRTAAGPGSIHRGSRPAPGGDRSAASLTRGPRLPGAEAIRWSMTVAEVGLESAEGYCADIRRWAESIVADAAPVVAAAEAAAPLPPPSRKRR